MSVDILPDLDKMIARFQYQLIVIIAEIHWSLQRAAIMGGYTVKVINEWLIDQAFAPLIAQTNSSLQVAVSLAFIIALLVLGMTYLLAAFVRLEVVDFRSAVTWYAAGALFFSIGPTFYQGLNNLRLDISEAFYLSTLQGLQSSSGGAFDSLDQVTSVDLDLAPLCDHLDVYLTGSLADAPIDGLDIALAYLRGHGQDVMGYAKPVRPVGCPPYLMNANPYTGTVGTFESSVPMDWNQPGGYFDANYSPNTWGQISEAERDRALALAGASQGRALTAWPLILFGLAEQIVHLLITIAMGITFISFGVAILFAFFKRTEVIAQNIINQWIELVVQTVAIALVQALVVGFCLAGIATGSAAAVVAIGAICLVFLLITLWSGVKAVWNSFNRLFQAMGQAAGGVIMTPGRAATIAAGSARSVAGASMSAGSNALAGASALRAGATAAQAAGVSLGGIGALSGAARSLAYLPGVRNTSLGQAAEQFTEGATTRTVARDLPVVGRMAGPIVGAKLLSDRDPDHADYDDAGRVVSRPMLVPAVADNLAGWTIPRGASRRDRPAATDEYLEDEAGEMVPVGGAPQRTGWFTPDAGQSAEADRQGEELEQHISGVLSQQTGVASPLANMLEEDHQGDSLKAAADALRQAASDLQALTGQLRVAGPADVAGVMGDVLRTTTPDDNLTHPQVGERMAQVMGLQAEGQRPPVGQDLARFGLFIGQALKLGLGPEQAEGIITQVKASPNGRMDADTRTNLDQQLRDQNGLSWVKARDEVDQLERMARLLPDEIVAHGRLTVQHENKEQQA